MAFELLQINRSLSGERVEARGKHAASESEFLKVFRSQLRPIRIRRGEGMSRRGWGKSIIGIVVFVFIILASSFALAACPEGKSEVLILLPNGTETMLCLPDSESQGVDNVADQSEDSIVPSACPSSNDDDITYYMGKEMPSGCWFNTHTLQCCS